MGNNIEACCRASLMVLGAVYIFVWNSFGVSMDFVLGFWICGRVVMPYMYSLSRYFWDLVLESGVRLV